MRNNSGLTVPNLWVVCVFDGLFYTTTNLLNYCLCRKNAFVLKLNTNLTQPFPHVKYTFNRLFTNLSSLSTRPIRTTTNLYKLITINTLELS